MMQSRKTEQFSFSGAALKVDREQILKGMAMKAADSDDYLDRLIDQLMMECKLLAEPAGWVHWYKNPLIDVVNQRIEVAGAQFSTAKTVSGMLKKTELLAVFAVSIGHEVEQFSKAAFTEGNALEGLIVDLIGSELAEATADCLQAEIEKSAAALGLQCSMRFSPGYCNWPVSDQSKLFALFDEGSCSIRLNNSSLMSPVKSVSGFIGAGSKMKKVNYKCSLCNDQHCIMRRRNLHA